MTLATGVARSSTKEPPQRTRLLVAQECWARLSVRVQVVELSVIRGDEEIGRPPPLVAAARKRYRWFLALPHSLFTNLQELA